MIPKLTIVAKGIFAPNEEIKLDIYYDDGNPTGTGISKAEYLCMEEAIKMALRRLELQITH